MGMKLRACECLHSSPHVKHRNLARPAPQARRLHLLPIRASNQNPAQLVNSDLQERAKRRVRNEIIEAGAKLGLKSEALSQQLDQLGALLPGMPINLEYMRASDWARVAADPDLAAKLVMLKVAVPSLNLEGLLGQHPRLLLWSRQQLADNLEEVRPVLSALPRPEIVLAVLPTLLDPRQAFSVVASVRKWFPKRDPLEVLQTDPTVVLRAQAVDVPLEPVFYDAASATWTAAGYSRAKQEEWQVYIDTAIYKRKPTPVDKADSLVVGQGRGGAGSGAGAGAAAGLDAAASVGGGAAGR